jgi:glycosyltransferase involved in cell wall biosynthesis
MRTQGQRLAVLEEALISVYAQTVGTFEILLMVHLPSEFQERQADLSEMISSLPPSLGEVIKLIPVIGGGRSRPLNQALTVAQGRWICHLDDDDLFLDNHFETILGGECERDSVAFSTYAASRTVKVLSTARGATYPYSSMETKLSHHRPFKLTYQLFDNALPICNVVVHTGFIRQYELQFDETYEVLEDYQYWMQVHRYADIVCLPVVTTMITARDNQTNSNTDPATKDLWDEHRARLKAEMFSQDRVVSGQEIALLAQLFQEHKMWGDTFKRLGVLFPLVKALANFTVKVRHYSPAALRSAVKRLLGRR